MDQNFMKEKKVLPLVLSMSLPMMLSMLINSLYNIIDSMFVARVGEKALTAIRALVTPGRLPEPRSVKASVNAGTATAMMMTKTTMATMMTITGYVRVLTILALVLAERS